jgi:GT2 family glycosyltransferase
VIYLLTVNYYATDAIARLMRSLPTQGNLPYQFVIVNNSPEDTDLYQLDTCSLQILEAKSNLGFGRACNLGLNWIWARDPDAIAWIINPDTYLPENTLERVPGFFARHPELSLVGTTIYTPTGDVWFARGQFIPQRGAILTTDFLSTHPEKSYVPCDWISGCSLLINLSHFSECPQFDPIYFLYYEDFDFCRRYASQGHQIAVTRELAIVHYPSSITNRNLAKKFQHSTFSYLLALEKYANPTIFRLRLLRLLCHALFLLSHKPQVALGKLTGILNYFGRVLQPCRTQS